MWIQHSLVRVFTAVVVSFLVVGCSGQEAETLPDAAQSATAPVIDDSVSAPETEAPTDPPAVEVPAPPPAAEESAPIPESEEQAANQETEVAEEMEEDEWPEPSGGNPILTGSWILTHVGEDPLAEDLKPPTLTVAEDGKFSGFGGVNQFTGQLDKIGSTLFGTPAMTRMAGSTEAMELESKFTSILDAAIMGQHDLDNNLVLTAPGQPNLVLKPAQ
jgi:hypothetical protein